MSNPKNNYRSIREDIERTTGRLSAQRRALLLSTPSRQGKTYPEAYFLAATILVAIAVAYTLARYKS